MRNIIYPQAGKIILVKYGSDGTLNFNASNIVANTGEVQSIAPGATFNTSELADGNSHFPVGVYDTGIGGQITVTMATFQPALYAALVGGTFEEGIADTLWATDEGFTVPSESPYTVTLTHTPKTKGTLIVLDNASSPFTKSETTPGVGQFSLASNTLKFNSMDAGKEIFVTYEWSATEVSKLALPVSGMRPALHAIISTEATGPDGIGVVDANIIIDKCKAIGDINQPTQQHEPQNWSFTLRVLKPRAGLKPVYWKYAKRA